MINIYMVCTGTNSLLATSVNLAFQKLVSLLLYLNSFYEFIKCFNNVISITWIGKHCDTPLGRLTSQETLKACIHYFLWNFYFSPNDSPSKTMKNVFNLIWKVLFVLEIFRFLYFNLPLFLPLSVIALEVDQR